MSVYARVCMYVRMYGREGEGERIRERERERERENKRERGRERERERERETCVCHAVQEWECIPCNLLFNNPEL